MKLLRAFFILLLSFGVGMIPDAQAGSLGKIFTRTAIKKLLKRDLVRDSVTAAKPLKARTVFRYTSKTRATQEVRFGLKPGVHMTSVARPGRLLSSKVAQKRYGLPYNPQIRETLRLQNQRVRLNKVIGGEPGYGEITSNDKIPAQAIRKVIPLR